MPMPPSPWGNVGPTPGWPAYPPQNFQPFPYQETPQPKRADVRLYVGIAATAVGAVSLAITGVSFARLHSLQNNAGFEAYRTAFTHDQSACDMAASGIEAGTPGATSAKSVNNLCTQANAWHVAGIATAVGGGVLLGTGIILIVTSDTVWNRRRSSDAGWQLLPSFGPDGAGALFRGSF